jgi:hypothetical protein
MSELEQRLAALAAEVEWPETPPLELRFEAAPRARPARRRALVIALAAVLVAIGIAMAVPPARSAILDFFRIGGVTVERVSALPEAEERSLAAGIGDPVSRERAEAVLGSRVALPASEGELQLYERDGVVSALLAAPEPVLLSQFRPEFEDSLLKKAAAGSLVEHVRIDDATEGLWIEGAPHVVFWLEAPPRLAGNVLLWERDGVTYRLEGKTLAREDAVELALELGD